MSGKSGGGWPTACKPDSVGAAVADPGPKTKMTTKRWDDRALRRAVEGVKGEVRWKEPLSRHTTLHIGGPADVLVIPEHREALAGLLRRARAEKIPVFIMGGSNLLVRDGGMRGMVVKLSEFQSIRDTAPDEIEAEAGVLLSRLARHALERELGGLEFALGIPGTMGGAVVMNAGTREGEMADVLTGVDIMDFEGEVRRVPRKTVAFGYRWSRLPPGVVVGAGVKLRAGSRAEIQRRMQAFIDRRKTTQPLTLPNAGSVFKNPEGHFAAKLVEGAGMKGFRVGDAQISEQHANFIVNRGRATAEQVLQVIRAVGGKVERDTGITLELEIRIVGQNG